MQVRKRQRVRPFVFEVAAGWIGTSTHLNTVCLCRLKRKSPSVWKVVGVRIEQNGAEL